MNCLQVKASMAKLKLMNNVTVRCKLIGKYDVDILIRAPEGESTNNDVNTVQKIVEEFLTQDQNVEIKSAEGDQEVLEIRRPGILSDASKLMVAKLIDGYLAEIAKDCNLPLSKFVVLAEMVLSISRPAHNGFYRAIDVYLKEHPAISKSERKKICKLMDCRKLSVDACMHAVQNKRLPLHVVVQVLFSSKLGLLPPQVAALLTFLKALRI